MHLRGTAWARFTVGALAVGLAPIAWIGPASGSADQEPLALRGLIPDTVGDATLTAFVKPPNDVEGQVPLGGTIPRVHLDIPVERSGTEYRLPVDPADIPAGYVSDTGLVTLGVLAADGGGRPLAESTATVRAVADSAGRTAWVDPMAATDQVPFVASAGTAGTVTAPGASTVAAAAADLLPVSAPASSTSAAQADDEVEVDDASSAPLLPDTVDADELQAQLTAAAGCTPGPTGGADDVVVKKKSASTTIGTSYPLGGTTAWMNHLDGSSRQFLTTLGVARNSGGYWQQSHTEVVERNAGFDWDPQTYRRSYRVTTEMVKIAHYYDRCPPQQPYYSSWEPVRLDGGYGEHTDIARPDFRNCAQITSTGIWHRSSTQGKDYTLSYGLKMSNTIGIDLSSRRAYNEEARLSYRFFNTGRWLCGNNDVPSYAGKVMERYNDA